MSSDKKTIGFGFEVDINAEKGSSHAGSHPSFSEEVPDNQARQIEFHADASTYTTPHVSDPTSDVVHFRWERKATTDIVGDEDEWHEEDKLREVHIRDKTFRIRTSTNALKLSPWTKKVCMCEVGENHCVTQWSFTKWYRYHPLKVAGVCLAIVLGIHFLFRV